VGLKNKQFEIISIFSFSFISIIIRDPLFKANFFSSIEKSKFLEVGLAKNN